ncbi:MAG: 3'-5' exonuclease [Elainellaceae cyanobacterium]
MFSKDLLRFYRQICQQPLTVVDVETTGRISYAARIIEVAVVRASLVDGVIDCRSDLVNPERKIPSEIEAFTGISQQMVDGVSPASAILPQYLDSLNQGVLTAHNLEFDNTFLRHEFQRLGIDFGRPPAQQLCTVQLSRLMLSDLPSRSLPKLVKRFQFPVGKSHRAEADAIACWLLAQKLLTIIANEDDEAVLARFGQAWISLQTAARLLKCSQSVARCRLEKAGVYYRVSQRQTHKIPMYRRGEVEAIALNYQETHQENQQLSLF